MVKVFYGHTSPQRHNARDVAEELGRNASGCDFIPGAK